MARTSAAKPKQAAASDPLKRVEAWFRSRGWKAFDFQREVWEAYAAGESGLIG